MSKFGLSWKDVLLATIIFVTVFNAQDYLLTTMHIISCTPDQPLVIERPGFLAEDVFESIKAFVGDSHPLIGLKSQGLSPNAFGGTDGFVVKFNKEGLQKRVRTDRLLAGLLPYVDAALNPNTNAWVMNVLICNNGHSGKGKEGGMEVAVKPHVDNTVGINSNRVFFAHQVDVLYLVVPHGMIGGELFVYELPGSKAPSTSSPQWHALQVNPTRVVVPQNNTQVCFRGDALHQVNSFTSKWTHSKRVSLVLEQYKIDDYYYPLTTEFVIVGRNEDKDYSSYASDSVQAP